MLSSPGLKEFQHCTFLDIITCVGIEVFVWPTDASHGSPLSMILFSFTPLPARVFNIPPKKPPLNRLTVDREDIA